MTAALVLEKPLDRLDRVGGGLVMADQDFSRPFTDPAAPGAPTATETLFARQLVLALAPVLALALGSAILLLAATAGGIGPVDAAIAILATITFWGIAQSALTAVLSLFWRPAPAPRPGAQDGLNIAILLPVYGEPASLTLGRAVALLRGLTRSGTGPHSFSLHILSDTRNEWSAAMEGAVTRALRRAHANLDIHYRRRVQNLDYKSGNLRDWITRQGALYDAALILDADSVMGAQTVLRMADELAADRSCAMVQTVSRILPGDTLWQRLQSFAGDVYGTALGRGFAMWTGAQANFFGHNALVRLDAFATAAGLPHLAPGRPRGGVILSHDFVEAALLIRAGWGVKMLPEATQSFEEAPPTLPAHFKRDRRWCQGNMQHLRLLAMPGLHPMSRLHLLQGALAFLNAPLWFALMLLGALPGGDAGARNIAVALLAAVAMGLAVPRILGIATYVTENRVGVLGAFRVMLAALAETLLTTLAAPVQMLHQTRAVLAALSGRDGGWKAHQTEQVPLADLARFHATEMVLGAVLAVLIGAGLLTVWLAPVATGLLLAVPLSWSVQRGTGGFTLFDLQRSE